MRALLWLLAVAALAVGTALVVGSNDGYALLVLPPWRIELSLNLFIVLAVGGFTLLYLLLRLVVHTLRLPAAVRAFRLGRARQKGENALRDAIRFQFEGRYGHALKSAARAYDSGHGPGLAALVAMRAAHNLHDDERQESWRQRAIAHDGDIRLARLMSEAEIAVEERRFDDATTALDAVALARGRHIAALRLMLRARQGRGDWDEVLRLIRQLEKHRGLTADQAAPLLLRAHREWLRALPQDAGALVRHWQALPTAERHHHLLAQDAVRALLAAGAGAEAQRIIEETLDEQWDSELAALYAECREGDSLGRIARSEKWLRERPRDGGLLLALGRLCGQQQLWGKAQSYLEASLSVEATRRAHQELAVLFDRLERPDEANRHYRAAAVL